MTKFARLIAIAVVVLPASAFAAAKLSPADIQSTFGTRVAFTASNVGGKTYTMVLRADGTATRTVKGSKTAEIGTWRASDAGYCSKWGKGSEHCYSIAKNGARYDVLNSANKIIAHWTI
jgi:hypothetical protein